MARSLHTLTYKKLIATLIEARVGAALTQQELARRLGRPQSFIAKIECCERRLDIAEFMELAHAIGFDPLPALKEAWRGSSRRP